MFRCFIYEFEEIVREADSVRLLSPAPAPGSYAATLRSRIIDRAGRLAGARHDPFRQVPPARIDGGYELFLFLPLFAHDLLLLRRFPKWRERCAKAACFLHELYTSDLPSYAPYLDVLREFDVVFVSNPLVVDFVKARSGRPCHYIPPGIDGESFCPYPAMPNRAIDCYSMGRRSAATHRELLAIAENFGFFYLHDTASIVSVIDWRDHRRMISNIIKRSRYFTAYPKANYDDILLPRYFEGIAGGAIVIGIPPRCPEFATHFDWPDAVVPIPNNAPEIACILSELDGQPERLQAARRNNICNTLLRHDWLYRWGEMLDKIGMAPAAGFGARESRLRRLADGVRSAQARTTSALSTL